MNKLALALTGAAACLVLVSKALAQDAIVHTVAFPQGDATWSVKAQSQESPTSQSPEGAQPSAQKARVFLGSEIVRQGKLRRDVITWADGTTAEMWWVANLPYVLAERNGRVDVIKAADIGQASFDESCFTWVSAKTYLGKKSYQGKDSQYYETLLINPATDTRVTLRAWIDPVTHQPLALFNGYTEVEFAFPKPAPIPPLQMPPNFQQVYTRLQDFYAHVK